MWPVSIIFIWSLRELCVEMLAFWSFEMLVWMSVMAVATDVCMAAVCFC